MCRTLLCGAILFLSMTYVSLGAEFSGIEIRTGARATRVELKCAQLLEARLTELGGPNVRVVSETGQPVNNTSGLVVLLGVHPNHDAILAHCDAERIKPLLDRDPGPEGYLVRSYFDADQPVLLAASVDQRGTLYAVGEILRQAIVNPDSVTFPDSIAVRTAPAFEVRGTQFGQSGVSKRVAKVRDWTEVETQRDILDSAIAGANAFDVAPGPMFEFLKSFDLMTQENYHPNVGTGPEEWLAKESIGRLNYLCPSVPEARAALIETCRKFFATAPKFDFVKMVGGDGGGCECDKCNPYGLTFIKLCEDMAAIIHANSPNTRIWFTNQKFDDEDDQSIFAYLQEKPREWLWAWGYGPGSDAMSWQPGHRQTHRMDLFRYPGFGPFDRYNQEIMHHLPPQQTLLHYNEITHWRYAQHAYVQAYPRADRNGDLPPSWNHFIYERQADEALTMVYDRLTFYAWPRFYHWVFGEVVRYGAGDITHSSGTHDHFNQWMWQRLLWSPHTSVEAVVDEYCRTWFGPDAAPLMAEAIFLLEKNLQHDPDKPITEKEGIDRYYDLVKQAGAKIPPHQMKAHWLWRQYMQKGALDKYIKLNVREQVDLQTKIEKEVGEIIDTGNLDSATALLPLFDNQTETDAMSALRGEAGCLGEESNTLYGVRSEGYYTLTGHDFIGLGWLKRQLERARDAKNDGETRKLLRMIVAYEDPGEGGFYDNCGSFNDCPNVVNGYPYDHGQPYVPGKLFEKNRLSQRTMHFTQDEAQGVTLHYRGLDPSASYRIRLTLVRPWYQERYADRMNQKSQTIFADDLVLAREVELPEQMSDFFTYDIPQDATSDGELVVRLEKAADIAIGDRVTVEQWRNTGGWGTLLSEAWLMKK
ncbi:MAG: hypothetical protein SGI88_07900 [Candidatus Hydrogenedentes bacterium]|nr:hypothetical protein [Candidatus Hydrogenedentota bacterium]